MLGREGGGDFAAAHSVLSFMSGVVKNKKAGSVAGH